VDFPTLAFFEIDYSLFTIVQASRRAWRIIQDRPCRVFYPFYEETMEHQAVNLIGRKQQAANLLYGETNGGGLSNLTGAEEGGGDLLAELAKAIDQDESVTDLRDLFARHARQVDPTESAWFVTEPEPEPIYEAEGEDDLIRFGVEELGGVVEAPESVERDEEQPIRHTDLLPLRQRVRRRKADILDAPEDGDEPIPVRNWPVRPPERVPRKPGAEVQQFALF
jgi:hypothetical protein